MWRSLKELLKISKRIERGSASETRKKSKRRGLHVRDRGKLLPNLSWYLRRLCSQGWHILRAQKVTGKQQVATKWPVIPGMSAGGTEIIGKETEDQDSKDLTVVSGTRKTGSVILQWTTKWPVLEVMLSALSSEADSFAEPTNGSKAAAVQTRGETAKGREQLSTCSS